MVDWFCATISTISQGTHTLIESWVLNTSNPLVDEMFSSLLLWAYAILRLSLYIFKFKWFLSPSTTGFWGFGVICSAMVGVGMRQEPTPDCSWWRHLGRICAGPKYKWAAPTSRFWTDTSNQVSRITSVKERRESPISSEISCVRIPMLWSSSVVTSTTTWTSSSSNCNRWTSHLR